METQNDSTHTLWVNGQEAEVGGIEELRAHIERVRREPFADICIEHEGGPLLTLMAHGDNAWLMFLRHRGDSGLNSRNLAFTGPIDSKLEFIHDTGERKNYPQAWVVPADEAFGALEYFYHHAAPSPEIAWQGGEGKR